jgi:flagellar biosynthetic protein FliP
VFAWHYLEMVAAMAVGMLILGSLRGVIGLTVASADHPGTAYLLMATDMALAMGAWMRFRRHSWRMTLQMCAAMYVPVPLIPLVWSGALSEMAFLVLAHTIMLAAMFLVLLVQAPRPGTGAALTGDQAGPEGHGA